MSLYSETIELRQEIMKLRSRNQYLFSLLRGLNTLAQAHVHGIPIVSLIWNMMFVGLTIFIDSFLIASLEITLYLEMLDRKIQQIKANAQVLFWLFARQIQLKIFRVYRKIRQCL